MRKLYVIATVSLGLLVAGASAAAATPATPPDPVATAASAIEKFGKAAVDVFLGLVGNAWVLGLFALGIGLAFASRVISKVRNRSAKPVG